MAWRTCIKIDPLIHISQLRSSREKSVTSLTRSKYRCVCTRRDVAFWPIASVPGAARQVCSLGLSCHQEGDP